MWFTGVGDPFFTILISKKVKQSRRVFSKIKVHRMGTKNTKAGL